MNRPDWEALIDAALVDTYNDDEELSAWLTVLEDGLAMPFEAAVLGVPVTVIGIDLADRACVCAVCVSGRQRQRIPLTDLALPDPPPVGAEWIGAYRLWSGRR